jgi:general secretion pathway protein K
VIPAEEARFGGRGFGDSREAGFIIITVLWILAALAGLVSVFSVFVIDTAIGSKLGEERLEAEALIKAGVDLAVSRVISTANKTPPTAGAFTTRIGTAEIEVAFLSEGARLDLNEAKKPLLAGLLTTLGADSDDAAYFADRIIGWRRSTNVGGRNEEVEAYQRAGVTNLPRQGPFQNVAELRLVLGLPPELVNRMLPFVTIFNGRAEIDPMVADPILLSALPNSSPGLVEQIVEARQNGDTRRVMDLMGAARSNVGVDPRKATRIKVAVGFGRGRHIEAEVVVLRMDNNFEPYRILAWQDDFDRPGA